jgi:hypothetical protein
MRYCRCNSRGEWGRSGIRAGPCTALRGDLCLRLGDAVYWRGEAPPLARAGAKGSWPLASWWRALSGAAGWCFLVCCSLRAQPAAQWEVGETYFAAAGWAVQVACSVALPASWCGEGSRRVFRGSQLVWMGRVECFEAASWCGWGAWSVSRQLAALGWLRLTWSRVRGCVGGWGREVGPGDGMGRGGRALLRRGEHEERREAPCAARGLGATSGHDE